MLNSLSLFSQGEYEFSPEILSGKLAEVVYRAATQKIKGAFLHFIQLRLNDDVAVCCCAADADRDVCFPTGADFVLTLLQIASIFDFTKDLQATILQE